MKPTVIREDDSQIGRLCADIFGKGFQSFRVAHTRAPRCGTRCGKQYLIFS
jgi:hypothetical protein